MATFKVLLAVCVLIAVVKCQEGGHKHDDHHAYSHAEVNLKLGKPEKVEIHAHPKFHYEYKVADDKHHDYHSHQEARDGHKVKGSYSLVEADGKTVRVVEYEADKKEGFRAHVSHKPHH